MKKMYMIIITVVLIIILLGFVPLWPDAVFGNSSKINTWNKTLIVLGIKHTNTQASSPVGLARTRLLLDFPDGKRDGVPLEVSGSPQQDSANPDIWTVIFSPSNGVSDALVIVKVNIKTNQVLEYQKDPHW